MSDRIRKSAPVKNTGQKPSQTSFYWVSVVALVFGALFWAYLLSGWGKDLWLKTAPERYGLLLLTLLSSLLCGINSVRQLSDRKIEGWMAPYILLVINCTNTFAVLVFILLFRELF